MTKKKQVRKPRATPLSEVLQELRNEAGLAQIAVARKLHVPQCHISDYETGVHIPRIDRLLELAEVYNVAPITLFTRYCDKLNQQP